MQIWFKTHSVPPPVVLAESSQVGIHLCKRANLPGACKLLKDLPNPCKLVKIFPVDVSILEEHVKLDT